MGQVITFDASAEIDDVIHFMADGRVGSANAVAVYSITGTAAAATSGVGAVTTAFAYLYWNRCICYFWCGYSNWYNIGIVMSDTVINMPDGSKWSPSSSTDVVKCCKLLKTR